MSNLVLNHPVLHIVKSIEYVLKNVPQNYNHFDIDKLSKETNTRFSAKNNNKNVYMAFDW